MRFCMVLLFLGFAIYANAQTVSSSVRFNQMLQNYYEEYLKLHPTTASYRGDNRYNDQLENDISQPYRDLCKAMYSRFQDSLRSFSLENLSSRDQLSYRIFEYNLKNKLDELKITSYLTPISQMRDFRISFSQMGSGSSTHPFKMEFCVANIQP